jgi:hypothetical protein
VHACAATVVALFANAPLGVVGLIHDHVRRLSTAHLAKRETSQPFNGPLFPAAFSSHRTFAFFLFFFFHARFFSSREKSRGLNRLIGKLVTFASGVSS